METGEQTPVAPTPEFQSVWAEGRRIIVTNEAVVDYLKDEYGIEIQQDV